MLLFEATKRFIYARLNTRRQLRGLVNTKIYKIYVIAVRVHFENQNDNKCFNNSSTSKKI